MTAKALTLALAATTAAATFADVYEVKFTMKTKVGEKVANKVISGIYDDAQDKHVFWTVEKVANEKGKLVNTNVPYQGTYFSGAAENETTVGKSVGANAELIWGGEDSPANVLVAGAWGKATSLSGQAAGMLDNVPATGTWSAKVNTKMSYDQLLAKYGLTQSTTLSKDEIAGTIAQIESQLDGIIDALATLSGKDAAALLGDTIIENYTTAFEIYKGATNAMEQAHTAYTNYEAAVKMDAEAYQAIVDQKKAELAVAKAALEAVTYTNEIVTAVDVDAAIQVISNKITEVTGDISEKEGELATANTNFDAALAELASATNDTLVAMNEAYAAKQQADENVEAKEADTYKDFGTWKVGKVPSPYENDFLAFKGWEKYRDDFEEAKASELKALKKTADEKATKYGNAQKAHKEAVDTYETAKTKGKLQTTIDLEDEIEALKKQITGYEADVAYWAKAYDEIVTANYRKQIAKDLETATEAEGKASQAVTDAEEARDNATDNLNALLIALAAKIGLETTDLQDDDGDALPLDEIKEKVDEFIDDAKAEADRVWKIKVDVEAIAGAIELTLPDLWK